MPPETPKDSVTTPESSPSGSAQGDPQAVTLGRAKAALSFSGVRNDLGGWNGTALTVVSRGATLFGFAAMFVFFWITHPVFGTWENIRAILQVSAPIFVLGVGLTIVLTTGEFDLSFPGIVGLAAVCAVQMMSSEHLGWGIAVLVGLGVGTLAGLIAGVLVSARRASSFIVTLALQGIWGGAALGLSGNGGSTIANVTNGYLNLTLKNLLGVPAVIVYAIVIAIVGFAVVRWTVFGRQAESIGENAEAARLAGVRVGTTKIIAFGIMGLCAGIAGVMLSSQTGQFTPDLSTGLFIPPFVAAFFGISVLAAGRFNVFGTLVGAIFISTLQTGLTIMGLALWVGQAIVGAALLVILFIAAQSREQR